MEQYEAGLHKDVSVIFDGVWNPEVDNVQQSFGAPVATSAAYVYPGSTATDQWAKEPRFATIIKVFKEAPGHIFRSRSRREKKRLLSISKHLIINQPG
jgi:hypothetical protein